MAPKTHGLSRGAAGLKRKCMERRSVREPTPTSDSSSSSMTPTASPAPNAAPVDHLAGRVIATGRKVDFELFEAEGFVLGRQLIEMGWEKLCSLDCASYPSLIMEFYKNLSRGDNGLVSQVRNVRVNVNVDILSRLLSLPHSGASTFDSDDRSPALSRLLNREIVDFEEVQANQLSLELRLLHNICSRILFSKTGRFDYVSERDIFVMDAVISGKPINLPCMMIWYMADCGSKKKSCLPYGMVLTLLFRSQGVVISDSEPMRNLRHTDYYSLATVHRMGFVKNNGLWERKGQTEVRATDADAPGPSERHTSPEPPCAPAPSVHIPAPPSTSDYVPAPAPFIASSSAGFSDTQLEQLRSLLDSQKESLKNDFESKFMNLKEVLYSLDDRVSKIESTLSSSTESLSTDLKNIFGELKDLCGDSDIYSKSNAELQDKIITACTFVDERLKSYVQIQSEGMKNIVDHLTRIVRTHF